MSDKLNIKKLVSKMHIRETKQLKHKMEFYQQPNEYVDYEKILNNRAMFSTQTPLFDKERLENLKKVKLIFIHLK